MNSSSSASRRDDAGLADDAPEVRPQSRRARRLAERTGDTAGGGGPDVVQLNGKASGVNGNGAGFTNTPAGGNPLGFGASLGSGLRALPTLDDETMAGDETDGPAPRPAPRYTRKRSVNGAFDDRTGLFEGPADAQVAAEPPAPGSGTVVPSLLPPEGALSGGRFGSSAFREVPEIDEPRPPQPSAPAPRRDPDPLPDDLAPLNGARTATPDAQPARGDRATRRTRGKRPGGSRAGGQEHPAQNSASTDRAPEGSALSRGTVGRLNRGAEATPGQGAEGGPGRGAAGGLTSSPGLVRLLALALAPALTGLLAAWLVVAALLRLFSHAFSSLFLLIVGGGVLYGLIVAANRVRNTEPARLMGADLLPGEHPRIWAVTAELAGGLTVPPLSRIVVDGGTSVLLSRGPQHRELLVGLPLLIGLDEPELQALIARELVAERSPDDANGRLSRLGPRLERALGTLRAGAARWVLTAYAAVYRVIAGPENARHDRWCDEQVNALGLPLEPARHRVGTTSTAWQVMLDEYLPLSSLAGRRPSLADAVEQILAARLTDPAQRRGPAATGLLDGGPEAVRALEGSILVDDDPRADWPEIVAVAARAEAELAAARLARAALTTVFTGRAPDQPVSLDDLLAALARGEGPAMVEPLLRPAIPAAERPDEARAVLAQHVRAFVLLVMLREGLARHVLSWTGPPVPERLDRGERTGNDLGVWRPWDLDELIEAAGTDAGALIARLRELGTDLGRAVSPAPVPPPRVLSAFADVELCGPFEARRIDLLIYDHGLLLAPAPAETPLRKAQARVGRPVPGSVSAADRVVRLAEQLGAEPGALPGGWWIERADIASGQLRERRTGLELQLRLADGAGAIIRATPMTSLRGTPVDDLGRMLPGLMV